jgi:heme A synthase
MGQISSERVQPAMKLYRFAILTTVATWGLLLIGGAVHPTGSSLACPDWHFVPTCGGEVFPVMEGGVLIEHGHRLWATLVGFLTAVLSIWALVQRGLDSTTRALAVGAVLLVALQGTLGGLTVLVGLSPVLSTLHLVTAYAFLGLLVILSVRLRRGVGTGPVPSEAPRGGRGFVIVGLALVLAQSVAGALVRHLGAGPICGANWLSCAGAGFWPDYPLAQLHMLHRFLAVLVLVALFVMGLQARRVVAPAGSAPPPARLAARIAWAPFGLGVLQAILGLVAVATGRATVLLVLHTGVAALMVASMILLYLSMSPLGVGAPAPRAALERA